MLPQRADLGLRLRRQAARAAGRRSTTRSSSTSKTRARTTSTPRRWTASPTWRPGSSRRRRSRGASGRCRVMWHTIVSPTGREKTGYPTQKPEGLLRRFVQASLAAGRPVPGPVRRLRHARRGRGASSDRRYLLIDESPEAVRVMRERLGLSGRRVRPRPGQPDRRAHRLQRRARDAVRDRARRDRHGDAGARASRSTPSTSASATRSTSPSAAEGWRAFAARDGRRAARRGLRRRARAPGDHRRRPAGQRPLAPPPRSRPRSRSRCSAARPTTSRRWRKLCSRVENDWVGAETGLLDQLASLLLARRRTCCGSTSARSTSSRIPLDLGDWQLVTVDSGATHTHRRLAATTSAAPSAARPARRSASRRCATRRRSARSTACCSGAPATWSARTRASTRRRRALDAHDLERSPRLLDASHASLRDDYEASVPEVEATVDAPEGRRSRRRPDGRRRLRRFGARATAPRGRPAGGCPRRRSPARLRQRRASALTRPSSSPSGRVNAHSRKMHRRRSACRCRRRG